LTPPPCFFTLSLHDALPISVPCCPSRQLDASSTLRPSRTSTRDPEIPTPCSTPLPAAARTSRAVASCRAWPRVAPSPPWGSGLRSEEHTSELQSRENLVCRL